MSSVSHPRARRAGVLAAILSVVAGLSTPAAHAADVSSIIDPASVTVTNQSPGANPNDPLDMRDKAGVAFDFSTTSPVTSGDTFGLEFPAEFNVLPATYPVYESGHENDAAYVIAQCSTTPSGQTVARVTCAFTDYAATLPYIASGHVLTVADIMRRTTSTTLDFTTLNGTVITAPLPGGSPITGQDISALTEPWKQGWVEASHPDDIHWVINFPSDMFIGQDVHITDINPSTVKAPIDIGMYWFDNNPGWDQSDPTWVGDQLVVNTPTAPHTLDVTVPSAALMPGRVYRVQYDTPLVNVNDPVGSAYTNSADVNGHHVEVTVTRQTSGSGNGTGGTTTSTTPTSETTTPVTSSTETSAPVTSSTETSAPVTSSTETSVPVTSSTETSAPVTSSTETSVPTTTSTEISAPVTSSTETSAPVTSSTETSAPVTSSTETSAPVTSYTETSAPVTSSTETSVPTTTSTETSTPVTSSTETSVPSTSSTTPSVPSTSSTTPHITVPSGSGSLNTGSLFGGSSGGAGSVLLALGSAALIGGGLWYASTIFPDWQKQIHDFFFPPVPTFTPLPEAPGPHAPNGRG